MLVAAIDRQQRIEIILRGRAEFRPLIDLRVSGKVGDLERAVNAEHEIAPQRLLQPKLEEMIDRSGGVFQGGFAD
jgi:hypothetical protein